MTQQRTHVDPLPDPDGRADLARRQAALVRALNNAAPAPEAFDADQLRNASESLARKRARAVGKTSPALTVGLGESFGGHFASYCADYPAPPESPFLDGLRFLIWLERNKLLPHEGRVELARYRVSRNGIPRILFVGRAIFILIRFHGAVRSFRIRF